MNETMVGLGAEIMGTVPGWITAGGITALIAVILNFILKNKAGDREGWGALIEALQNDISNVREEHRRCQMELADIRRELSGVQRMVIAQSSVRAVPLREQSQTIKDAAERSAAAVLRDIEKSERRQSGEGETE
jgi:hypothetical protein